jgi:D-alanyl-D-alanine dipeptidase
MTLKENNEPLVQAGLYPEKILTRSWYFFERLPGSLPEVWVRESVYDKLLLAADLLPEGLRLVIWDGWRSYDLQSYLFKKMLDRLKAKGITGEEAREQASVYVAIPSKEPETVSGHSTGGAVDITLADMRGHYLNMGGGFDEIEEHSQTWYYENPDRGNVIARNNRRLLIRIMESAGFSNYPNEWWHFDYGNNAWAVRTKAEYAFYGYTEPPFKWR